MYKPVFKTPVNGKHYYFGYYDKSPLSADGKRLLALEVDFIDRLPTSDDTARIGYFDLASSHPVFVGVSTTRTFNWQQGCMLQWLGSDYNSKVIFNDLVNNKFVSRIINLETGEEKELCEAIYTVLPNGSGALCIDNERHHWCRRGYSYDGVYNSDKNQNIVPGDGISYLDFESNSLTKIIDIGRMNAIKPLSTMADGPNYLEHLMISPSGKRFSFLHRWKNYGGIYARLYTADINGSDICLLNDSGRMSHFCWRGQDEILAWGGLQNPINSLRKYKVLVKYLIKPLMPLYRRVAKGDSVQGNSGISKLVSGDSYILFKDKSKSKKRIAADTLNKDGHPSFSKVCNDRFITDTYPSIDHKCDLLLYSLTNNKVEVIDRLKSIPEYDESPLRCDLHPKWSFCGNYVCVDTMNDGCRGMYLYKIE